MDLSLDDFLTGTLAVLAYEGRQKLVLATGVLDIALVQTLDLVAKQMERERIRPQFRLTKTSAKSPRSDLRVALRSLEEQGVLGPPDETGLATIAWNREAAY